jgi:acylphosphatase
MNSDEHIIRKKIAYLIAVRGQVTGVGFRFATLDKAECFPSLSGYVRNLTYGEVEVFLQGNRDEAACMIEWLRVGPPMARVISIDIKEVQFDEKYDSFRIEMR